MKAEAEVYGLKDDVGLRFVNQSSVGIVGERKYIISAQWWRMWCDYANFGDKSTVNDSIYSNSHHNRPATPAVNIETRQLFSVYEKPSIISNE